MTGDSNGDPLIITSAGGFLQHNRAGDPGFASAIDWDSTVVGNQTLPVNAASIINLDTGGGADPVSWGNATVPASTLLATLNYNAGGNSGDTLLVDDGGNATPKTYTVQSTSMTATGIAVTMVSTTITGGKTLRTSSGVDTVNVITVAASEPVNITTSGGADNVNINGSNGVQNIAATVTVSNPTGGGVRTNLTVDNSGNATAQTANINDTGITTFAPAAINYNGNEIATLIVRGGSAGDTFNVTPTSLGNLSFNIQGNLPTAFPGDTLNVNLTNVASPQLNSTGTGAGNITFGNRTTITYSEIERVTSGGTGLFAISAINATAGDDAIVVAGNGTDTIVTINGNVVFRGPTSEISGNLTINGLAGNDTLTGNFTAGNPIPSGNLVFDGGAGGNDSMVLFGTFNTVRHFFTNANDGRVEVDGDNTDDGGAGESRIIYAGLDPITDNMNAVNRVFTFNNGTDVATLGDDATPGNNMLQISTTNVTSETVVFVTPTGNLTVNLDSGGVGNDTLTMTSFDSASIIAGNITINAGDGTDLIIGNIVTPSNLAGNINIFGGNDIDEVRILATPTGTSTNIDTGLGSNDRVFIGGNLTLANFNTGLGTLVNIRGAVNINDSGGASEVYVDDTGNATSGTYTMNSTGAVPVFGGGGVQLTKTGVTGVISYTRFSTVAFQLATGAGNDTINVNSTNGQVGANTTIFANAGNDTFNIAGDGLGGFNDFQGNLGSDQFNLTITTNIGSTNPDPISSLTLRGDDPAGNSTQRDRVTIQDNSAASRFLNYQYLSASAGNMDIQPVFGGSGLFGPVNANLQIRAMETVVFGAAGNNDFVNVTGTATDDLLTVALRNNNTSALVFRGGTPYLDAPPVTIANSRPGVAGGGTGPDLFIQGITAASGIFLSGGGAGASGDRAIVYGASEGNLTDTGNPTDIFGLGAGVLQPGFGTNNAYDTITVTDAAVNTTNNSAGALTPVLLNTATFLQSGPPATQNAGLTVDGGDEANPQGNGRADVFNATISSQFFIQINGNLPNLTVDVFGNPLGDELNVTVPGSVNVYSDSASPPNVTVSGIPAITGNFGISFSSIERATFSPTNGVVNIIGDNNQGNVTQNDLFVVRGRDIDGNGEGVNEFSLQISGNKAGGNGALSSPIFFGNVTRINASGGEALGFDANGNAIPAVGNTGIDTLDITAYADNTPRGWGIETYFNEGDPILDGDLLIFNGVLGVSDAIVVAPSGPESGQVFSNNAATNTPIAVVNYTLNTDIIVNASAPPATPGDTDTLALRGTNPANGNTTGNDFFAVDFGAAGTPAAPLVVVTDNSFAGQAIYTLQNLTNFATVTFEMQGGNDNMTFRTPGNGTFSSGVAQAIVLGGAGDDNVTVNTTGRSVWSNGRLTYDGGTGVDTLNITGNTSLTQVAYTPGPIPGNGQISHTLGNGTQTIDFVSLEPVNDDTVATLLIVNGDNADNAINYGNGGILNGNLSGIVTIDSQEFIRFANKGNLTINGGAGSDTINLNNPTTPTGLTGNITVNGGDPTGSDTLIINGRPGLQDQIRLLPLAEGAGNITSVSTPQVSYTGIEHIQAILQPLASDHFTVDGTLGNDDFHIATSAIAGNIQVTGVMNAVAGVAFNLPVIDITGNSQTLIGTFNFNNAGGNDRLTVVGVNSNETFNLGRATATSGNINQLVNGLQNNFIGFANFGNITIESTDGDDTFNVPGDFPTTLLINGGAPDSGSDVLNFTGTGGNITIDLAAQTVTQAGNASVSFTGIETLNVAAVAGAITILGTAGPDSFDVTPTGNTTTTFKLASLPNLTINTTNNVGSLLTLDSLAGSDTVRVNGQADADTIAVIRGGNTTVQVDTLKLLTLPSAATEALVIAAGLGDDVTNVTGTGGPANLVVDGGSPTASDTLNISTGTNAVVGVNYGTDPATGVVTDNVAGNVTFADIEHLGLTGAGATTTLTINGTAGNDAINQSGNLVTVNNGADVTFTTYPTLTLNGNNGDDVINVRPTTLVGVTTFNVNGGDPTASDKLIVNGNASANVIGYNPADTIGAGNVTITGAPTVNFTTTESVVIDGNGGVDTLTHTTPAGGHFVTFTPGSSPDAGTILTRQSGSGVALVPMSFSHIGAAGAVITLASAGGREDTLELDGTNNSDVFNITGAGNLTQILTPGGLFVTDLINASGITTLIARGLDGDDTFNLTGNLPFATTIDAGNPSASDVVNLTGAIGNVTIDLNALTVTGYGGTVSLIGVEVLNASAGANAITINGTAGPDNFTVTPTGNTTATTTLASLPTLTINTTNDAASLLTLNPLGGSDNLRVNGTQGSETLTVNATQVIGNTTGFKTVTYANTENLQVFGLAGNDTFNVTPSGNTTIFIDGGDPIGSTPGDQLNLNPAGAFQIEPGPENDEGGLVSAGAQRVSWDHIEGVAVIGGGPGLILGTNGDDDITIIARDSSTHAGTDGVQDFTVSVNQGPNILFINQPFLFVDALAGDDDVVVRAPAPNGAVWNVQLTIAGGPPSAVTGDQGDVFEFETPGTGADAVIYQPTGSDTGNITLDQATDSVIQLVNTFTFAPLGYISSPGGFEDFIYDGEGDNDLLTIVGTASNDTIVHTPGTAFDEGRFRINSLLGMTYQNLGNGTITADGGAGNDTLVYNGTTQSDAFTVTPGTGNVTLVNSNFSHLPIGQQVGGNNTIENLALMGLANDDVFNIAGSLPYLNTLLDGGDPSSSDALNLSGATAGTTTVNIGNQTVLGYGGVISLLGTETVNVNGADAVIDTFNVTGWGSFQGGIKTLNLNGADAGGNDGDIGNITATGGLDTITYTPLGTSSARFDRSSTDAVINISGFNATPGNLLLDAAGSSDQLNAQGSSRPDLITAALVAGNPTRTRLTFANNPGGGGLWVPLDFTSVETLDIFGGDANDRLDVDNSNGLVAIANGIYWDGQVGNDSLRLIGNQTVTTSTYNVGPNANQGSSVHTLGGATQTVFFNNLEPVVDLVAAATLVVNATNADNAINYSSIGVNGLVAVDGFETVEFANKTNLTINALAGSDTIHLNSSVTPPGLTSINVNGNDTTGSDLLMINGVAATTTITLNTSTITGATGAAGAVPIIYSGIESIKAVAGASTTLAVANSNAVNAIDYSVTPGVALDEGLIQPNTPGTSIPINYKGFGSGTTLALIADALDGDDSITVNGTAANDTFNVAAATGAVTIVGRATITQTAVENLTLNGLEGDDTFNIAGAQPYSQILVSGGDPSASDIVNLSAATGAVTVNLADHALNPTTPASNTQVTGYGGTITLTSVEVTNLSVNGNTLTANGTTQPDTFTYSPTGAAAGTFVLAGLNETFNFSTATAAFTINGSIGADAQFDDQVIVNGTNNHDFMTVNSPTRTVSVENAVGTVLKPVVLGASIEIVTASAGFGNDTILVIPAPATATGPGGANPPTLVPINLLIYVDGGAPNASDALVVAQAGGVPLPITDFTVVNRSRIQDSGVVRVFRNAVAMPDIVYSNVEVVSPIVPTVDPALGDPQLLILGPDLYEQNEFRATASFLGNTGNTINLTNLAIFPNVEEHRFVPADEDWFRVVAQKTGTLDFQVYFRQFAVGLLPQGGDLDIEVRDASGDLIANFGVNDGNADERRRIPAVAGQTYYLRVRGANTSVVNGYSVSIVNEAPPVPYAMELEDVVVGPITVASGAATNVFTAAANAKLSTDPGFYIGKYVDFLSGNVVGQRGLITAYSGATLQFTVSPITAFSTVPSAGSTFQIESTDTGRSQLDNQTRDNTPTIFFRLDDAILLNDIQGNAPPGTNNPPTGVTIPIPFQNQALAPGYRIAIFDEGNVPPQGTSGAPQVPIGFATNVYNSFGVLQQGLYTFTFPTALSDGSHFLSARVQIIDPSSPTQTGFADRSVPFEIVVDTGAPPIFFGLPGVPDDGLDASSDSGVILQPNTFSDNITNDNTPAFFGTAEANSVIRLYVDLNGNNDIDSNDVLIGQSVATPFDGTNQFPGGRWVVQSNVNLNDPRFFNAGNGFPTPDGLRHIMVQAEDVSGNTSAAVDAVSLDIFLDTTGPRVEDVFTIVDPTYELFDPKPSTAGPTPLIDTIDIVFLDLPVRDPNGQFVYPAVNEIVAETIGNYEVIGDQTGRALIIDAEVVDTTFDPDGVRTTVRLTFDKFLPDDRFTLVVNDSIVDDAGNNLDGESQASSPFEESTQQGIIFPSGDGQPGGDFSARFTVDTRPEIGMYAAARVSIDINGNFLWDPEGQDNDTTNRDLQFTLGYQQRPGFPSVLPMTIHDAVFAGNFHNAEDPPSGFDKLAAYGFDSTINAFRWLIDVNHDGVVDPAAGDVVSIQPAGFQINGIPFAGDWDPGTAGDEIGLYDGTSIWLDTNGDNVINGADTRIFTALRGLPLAGDFDGDGNDDFATWKNDFFSFDLNLDGVSDDTINFGFPGVSEKPIAADMDQDGITDIGLMVPGRSTTTPPELAEWYILQSNFPTREDVLDNIGTVNLLNHQFSPVPLGADLYANFGDEFALPIVGNFDPPVTSNATNNLGVVHMAKEATASSVSGTQNFSYQTMRAGTLSVDVTSGAASGGLTVQLLNNAQQVIASAVSDAQGHVHFDKALASASSGVIKVLGAASNVVLHVQNVVAENDLLDVDRDGHVSAIDLVKLVSRLNTPTQAALGMSAASDGSIYYDTNQDGYVTAFDLLKIVERLNRPNAPASSSLVASESDSSDSASVDTSGIAFAVSLAPTKTPLTTSGSTSASSTAAAVDSVFGSDEDDYEEDSLGDTFATSEDEDDAELITDLDLEWLE